MKKVIKIIIFLIIFYFLLVNIFKILWLDKNSIGYFHDEPKNSLDVVYIGSSNAYAHFNTVLAYDKYGFTTGMVSADAQNVAVTKYMLIEAQKYQKPKVFVIDIGRICDDDLYIFSEGDIRKTTDSMTFSKNRKEAIDTLLKYRDTEKDKYINYYISLFMYHNTWKNITEKKFVGDENLYKGYVFSWDTSRTEPQEKLEWVDNYIDMPEEDEKILLDLIDYIKSNNLNVLFVIPRKAFDEEYMGRFNTAISIINENGLKVLNFNNMDDFDVDFNTDLYNAGHLNVYGATKYTLYFSKYLKENYDLPDHSNDPLYSSWDDEYKRFKESFGNKTGNNFDELLLEYNEMY